MMTREEIADDYLQKAADILEQSFKYRTEISKHRYEDRQYFEADIDLLNVEFTRDTLHSGLERLIYAYEQIMSFVPMQIDFIAANDDTETEISRYEKDINDVKDFGLFVTSRTIPKLQAYYSSDICTAYVNLTHVSFGVYY